MGAVNGTNAWFTAKHNNGVQIEVDVGNLKLKVPNRLLYRLRL